MRARIYRDGNINNKKKKIFFFQKIIISLYMSLVH